MLEASMRSIKKIPDLLLTFMKIGAFTFGGGYAMIPIMQREVVDVKGWVTDEDIVKLLVISESTPGVIAVNAATYIGYHIAGFWGVARRDRRASSSPRLRSSP
ncbi:MAG: chromate transporter [Comamonadaceae bacterium]|nr:chromate transporter [Comamonadaceae bacterium]